MTGHDRLRAATEGQLGTFTRGQARQAGVSDRELRSGVHSRTLEQVGARTYRSPLTPHSVLGQLVSLILDIGEPCFASGPTAAALHRFDGFTLKRPFHVVVPRGRFLDRVGAVIHTSVALPFIDCETVTDLPVLSPTRTLIDIARCTGSRELTAAVDGAIRDGLTTMDLLLRRIYDLRGRGRYGLPKLLDVISGTEVTRGGHSWLEREFLAGLAREGLPRPLTQQILTRSKDRMVRVDCHFPGTRIVVELLGYRWHRTELQLRRDAERANALLFEGFQPYQFTTRHLIDDPTYVFGCIRTALASASAL